MSAKKPAPGPAVFIARPQTVRMTFVGETWAVRDGLRQLFDMMPLCNLSPDGRGTAQIVLAEALNNIVEHAYANHDGQIEVALHVSPPDLVCEITDSGLAMPEGALPAGTLTPLEQVQNLPEGGFGWYLIRTLARDLHYRRDGGRNLLSFRLDAR